MVVLKTTSRTLIAGPNDNKQAPTTTQAPTITTEAPTTTTSAQTAIPRRRWNWNYTELWDNSRSETTRLDEVDVSGG